MVYSAFQGKIILNKEVVGYCTGVDFNIENNPHEREVVGSRISVRREGVLRVSGTINELVIDGHLLALSLGDETLSTGTFTAQLGSDERIGIRTVKRQRTSDTDIEVYDTGTADNQVAQSFTATGNVVGMGVLAYKEGSPTVAKIEIQGDDSGEPDGSTVGTAMDILSQLGTSAKWCGGDKAVTLTKGNTYWLVAQATGGSGSDTKNMHVAYQSTEDKFTDGSSLKTTDGGTNWSANNYDLAFFVEMQTDAGHDLKIEVSDPSNTVSFTFDKVMFTRHSITIPSDGFIEESAEFSAETVKGEKS